MVRLVFDQELRDGVINSTCGFGVISTVIFIVTIVALDANFSIRACLSSMKWLWRLLMRTIQYIKNLIEIMQVLIDIIEDQAKTIDHQQEEIDKLINCER